MRKLRKEKKKTKEGLKRRAKAETVSLRAIIYGTLQSSERQKVWSKDLFLMTSSRAQTDQSRLALRTESSLSHPKISDEIIESNLLGRMKKKVTSQSWIE